MKIVCAAAILAASAIAAGSADADPYIPGFYTVINYSGAFPDYRKIQGVSLPSELDGVEVDIGWRFNRFYSVEASYSYFNGQKTGNSQSLTATLQDGSIDALGYLPLGWSSPWALYADVGGTYYFASAHTGTASVGGNESTFGARAGGGLQYMIDEDLGVRIGGRYDWTDLSHLKAAEVFAFGLVWQR
jgi:opacity protein-like surface antigen